MDPETKAWCLFCATVFAWMGVSLSLDAPEHAESALSWMAGEGKADPAARRRLTVLYRCGGMLWAAFGLWLLCKTLGGSSVLAASLPRRRPGRAGRLLAGAFFFLGGSLLAAVKAAAGLRRGGGSALERAGRLWGWVIVLALLAFGSYLLRGSALGGKG
jgi:hypothetical protein